MTYRYRLAAVFLMGFFVDCINIFMPAIALPTIAAEFHVGGRPAPGSPMPTCWA